MTKRQFIFHPITVLFVSLVAATIFAFFVNLFFDGDLRWFLLYYFTPIGIPFVAFLFDRAEQYTEVAVAAGIIDLIVLIPALTRAFVPIPFLSGHALFLSYGLLSSRSNVARIAAILVLLQVVYLKTFVTHDTAALFGGVIVGGLAAFVHRWVQPVKRNLQVERDGGI